jgi:hypothetical protein
VADPGCAGAEHPAPTVGATSHHRGTGRGIRPSGSNGNGYKTSVSVRQDVLREGAQVKVVSCLQDGVGGSPYNCGIAYGGGNSAY